MSTGPMLADLIRDRDRDALTGFYDGRAGYVAAYSAALCPADKVGDATLAAFCDFLARIAGAGRAGPEIDVDLLLVKATRGSAAARIEIADRPVACRAAPELLAASANGELAHGDRALAEHLEECATCQATAQRLLDAERQLKEAPSAEPPADVRAAWLRIALGDDAGS
jgi:hypothetical protein